MKLTFLINKNTNKSIKMHLQSYYHTMDQITQEIPLALVK